MSEKQRWNKAGRYLEQRCSRCGTWHPATPEYFVKRKGGGIRSRCKKCASELAAEWRAANPDYHRQWVKNNPGKMAKYSADYRERHRDEILERDRMRRAKQAEHLRALHKRYRENNRDKMVAAQAKYRVEHPDGARESVRRWRKEHAGITQEIRAAAGEYYKAAVTFDDGETVAGKIIGRLDNGLWVVRLIEPLKVGRNLQRIIHVREPSVIVESVGVYKYDPANGR